MVLRQLSAAEFAVWSLFTIVISLQGVAELGFGVTFARVVAYAMGGAVKLDDLAKTAQPRLNVQPNWSLIGRILATMRTIYRRLGLIIAALLIVGGTLAVWRPIIRTANPQFAWVAWACVVLVTLYTFQCNQFSNFLQGTNHIALLRRWETLFSLGSIGSSFLVLSVGGGLLSLVLAHQVWMFLGAFRNARLARHVFEGRFHLYPSGAVDLEVFASVWPSAWRSGIGTVMSFGLIQVSGMFHAQSRDLNSVNSYLLALRLLQAISQFSQAPFYSKLPVFARLYAEGQRKQMLTLAEKGMIYSYWSFVAPVVILGFGGPWLMAVIGSSAPFPSAPLWISLSAAILAERYGAMHLQLYSTTNHIIWHIANGVTGAVMILFWILLYPSFGSLGLAFGILFGNLSFYSWFSSARSHRAFHLPFPWFDFRTVGLAVLVFVISAVLLLTR